MKISSESVLFVTLDSCRFDTFTASDAPVIKSVGRLHKAQAPSFFTYGSHTAMFVGFTPGVAAQREPFLNPKYSRLFRLHRAGWPGTGRAGFDLHGRDIVNGFRNGGYRTVGTGAVGWFDPSTSIAQTLIGGFDDFYYSGDDGVQAQVSWVTDRLAGIGDEAGQGADVFAFLNIGETHVPYHFAGAPWLVSDNPCIPFQTTNRADTCRLRQRLCLEYVDRILEPLIMAFRDATILICADHGDCWGEEGLWEHGISHPMTLTVPLLIRYKGVPQ